MEKYDDIHLTEDEIYRELLAVATDNEDLLATSPEHYRSKVMADMTSLVRRAGQDADIRQFFLQARQDPEQALETILQRAVQTVASAPHFANPPRS